MAIRSFPQSPQAQYLQTPGAVHQGFQYAYSKNDEYLHGLIRDVVEVSQANTATVTFGVNGDVFGVVIDGLAITAEALTSDDLSAAALNTAIQAYITAYGTDLIASSSVATNVVTFTFADALPHEVTALDSGTTSSVIAQTAAAASYARLTYGLGVALDTGAGLDFSAPDLRAIKAASSGSDVLLGVLAFDFRGEQSKHALSQQGYDPNFLPPVNPHKLIKKGYVTVPWVGTLPTSIGAPVYWINDPATASDLGKFRGDANGGEADLVGGVVEGVIQDLNLVQVKFDL